MVHKADVPDGCTFRSDPEESAGKRIQTMHILPDFSQPRISSSIHPEDIPKTETYKKKSPEEAEFPFLLNSCGIMHLDSQP